MELTFCRGGIRGIVELEILRLLEKELGDLISIQSFFDLIVGTSTGGIIALGLTARNWSVVQRTLQAIHSANYATGPFKNASRGSSLCAVKHSLYAEA